MSNFGHWVKKNSPELLMAAGIAGLTFSTVWGIKATVKATHLCDEKKAKENKEKLTAKEVIKTTWKCYWPVALSTVISIPCIIASNRVSSMRNAALAAACTLSTEALQAYTNQAVKVVGEQKAKEISESVNQEAVTKSENKQTSTIICEGDEQLWFEPLTGRYFKSTWNKIQQACNEINEAALGSATGSYTLNDWCEKLGLDYVEVGDVIGWAVPSYGYGNGLMKIEMTTAKTKDNKVCGCIDYRVRPYPIQ